MKIFWRVLLALVVLVAFGTAVDAWYGEKFEYANAYSQCQMVAPEEVVAADQAGKAVHFSVEESAWPLTPVCHWRVGTETRTVALLDDTYTYKYYGGLWAAGALLALWAIAEVVLAFRRYIRRRLAVAPVSSV